MIRRLLNVAFAIMLSSTTMLVAAGPAVANHLECGTADPHDVLPADGGRVTIVYESELLRSPAFPNAAVVADHVQNRAEAALQRYDQLGFPVPPSVTIYMKCRLSAAVLYEIDRNGFTEASDKVQLKTDYIHAQFANIPGDNTPGSWIDDRAGWKNLVDHEMFHTVHHLIALVAWDYVAAAEKTIVESGATLAQDFFADSDDLGNPSGPLESEITYYRSVQEFFANPKTIASDTDESPAYQAGAFFQYLGERFGSQAEANLEVRVAAWLEELATADGVRIDAMRNAIDPDAGINVVYDALLDFLIAAYVPDHPNLAPEHKILDERTGHGGVGTGSSYPPLTPEAGELGVPLANLALSHDESRVHAIDLPPGTVQVAVTFEASRELLLPGTLYVATVPIDNGEARIADAQRSIVLPDGQPAARIFQVAGAEELAIFVANADHGTRYDLTVADAGGTAAVDILDPTQNRPRPIGPSADPEQLTVEVMATVNSVATSGLTAGAFDVSIGGQAADVLAAVPTGTGRYDLLVQPPSGLSDGEVDLTVTFADSAVETETDAIIIGESPGAAVAIVIDNSGSMFGSRIAAAKDAAIQFVSDMELGDQIAVVTFNSSATVRQALVELTDEAVRQAVISTINGITASGNTNLAAGINAGNQQLASAFVGFARAQVFLSDGQDSSDIATAIANTPQDVDIHTVALDTGANQARLQQIADGTGGTFFFASDESQLANLYALIRARITDAEFSYNEELGHIGLGEVQARTIPVLGDLDEVRFGARWIGSDYDLTLTSPTGRIITEANTDADVTVEHGANFVNITVATPEAGAWQASVEGIDLPNGAEPVTLEVEESGASQRSDLYLNSVGSAGTPIEVRFVLTEPAGPIIDAEVTAVVTDPNGGQHQVELTDLGGPADGSANDGIYGALVWGTDVAGSYTVTARATGTSSSGSAFARVEAASVALSAKVDTDGDGIADEAEPYFGFDPAEPDDGAMDLDADGLTTAEELTLGTDPRDPDTDRGGESDGSEVSASRDPTLASDDQALPTPVIGVVPKDGSILSVLARTSDGTGTVRLERMSASGTVALGSHAGAGVTVDDGPLPVGDYQYAAVAVGAGGAESAPLIVGPFAPAGDVTPPWMRITVNGGIWETTDRDVDVAFTDVSESVVEMRLAESEADLESATWVPYATPTSFTIGPGPGTHIVYAQVRDAAGNISAPATGVVDLQASAEPTTIRVSVASDGTQATAESENPWLSADGRYAAFQSAATNLVAGDTNAETDVFVHDRASGTTTRASVSATSAQGNDQSTDPAFSADGSHLVFRSQANNFVAGDTNGGTWDIFVKNMTSGVVERVNVSSSEAQATGGGSDDGVTSADGQIIAFKSDATNMVSGDTNGTADVFVRDRAAGTTTRVSVTSAGAQATGGDSEDVTISDDGRYVSFWSEATNLVVGDTNATRDVFVHDRQTGTTTRVSVASDGTQANGFSSKGALSADGAFVAFHSEATNLVVGDTNARDDVFIHELATGITTRVSLTDAEGQGTKESHTPKLSADGRYVTFYSTAPNLVAGDTNNRGDVFVRDRVAGTTTRVSITADGSQGNDASNKPFISADGSVVVFEASASNLVGGDTNAVKDVFVRGAPWP